MSDARRPAWIFTVPRALLVLAVVLGLCAMHVLAATVSQHHSAVHGASASLPANSMADMDHTQPATAPQTSTIAAAATSSTRAASTRVSTQGTDHEHHHLMGDCVLFLSAGIALLVVLLAWAAARALRPSYWLTEPWLGKVITVTPWRGPPPWHWPRISLCVIRV